MRAGFAWKLLRERKGAFAGAFVALLCAAALVCACLMLLETGLRGTVSPERYAGAPAVVAADQFVRQTVGKGDGETKTKAKPLAERAWLPETVVETLRRTPGVSKVVAEVTFPFGAYTAHGWESAALTPFTIARGREPRGAGEIVVDARARLEVGARLRGYRVVGVTAQALPSQDTVFFSTTQARRLAGRPGMVSAAGVFPGLARAPQGAVLYTGDERGRLEFLDAEQARVKLISMGGALAGTSLIVAILVVVGTFALSIQQRQRELALLRAVAATPRQLRRLVGGQALVVGVLAGVPGAAAGVGLGLLLHAAFVALGATPANLPLVVSPFPPLLALLATVAAAWAAARVSARRLARIRPVEALGEAALDDGRLPVWRLVAGPVLVAGAVTLTLVLSGLDTEAAATPVTMLTALFWTVAVSVLGPLAARLAVAVLGPLLAGASRLVPSRKRTPPGASRLVPSRKRTPPGASRPAKGASGFLAARNLRATPKALAAVLSPLTLMVAMTCTILFTQTTMGAAAQEQAAAGTRADHVLPGAAASAAEVGRVPGVRAVTPVLRTSVRFGLDKYPAQAVVYDRRTLDLGVVAGTMDGFGKGAVALSSTAAAHLGLAPGDRAALTLGDGTPATLKVAAVYSRGLGFGDVTLPYELVAGHVDDPSGTLLVAAPGITLPGAAPATATIGSANPQVTFVALGLIIAFTAIAVVNTLAMATSGRARELAVLRLAGTTRRQVLRMLRLETLAAVLAAVVTGTAVALVTLAAFGAGMTGSAVPSVPPVAYGLVVAAATVLALLSTTVPARLALRTRPAEAVSST
ncbi:ABC transporter transmembrane protein [[Actinomadura] parvosata subsp. kistnae]|uniref:ABC transporter permease n=1 Tax=[Actinomadura] parvosata subsp. kistnae TaxID=1909395 RepID=A0A1V0AL36_9ACTN|nr:ABC transporter permease [Nonomuraea sp. ATCC 55076]SPL95714.1 ABC transporter transmembrane protein [Actinomadura parvosata subsp. kistnae]